MLSLPPSQNKREYLELLGNLIKQMLHISLVFSPQVTSWKYIGNAACPSPIALPFPTHSLPTSLSRFPPALLLLLLPVSSWGWCTGFLIHCHSSGKCSSCSALNPFVPLLQVYPKSFYVKGQLTLYPWSCLSVKSLPAPGHPLSDKVPSPLAVRKFSSRPDLCQHCGSLIHVFAGLLLHSAAHVVPTGCAFYVCWVGDSLPSNAYYKRLKEGSWWCFFIGGHHLPLEAFTGCSTA